MITHAEVVPYLQRRTVLVDAKRAELIAKIEALTSELRELDVVKRHLKEWETQTIPLSEDDRVEETMRSAMKALLRELAEFTTAEIIQAVKLKVPGAKDESIQSELSKAVNRSEATRLTTGNYRGTKPAPPAPVVPPGQVPAQPGGQA